MTPEIVFVEDLPHPIAEVWASLTDSASLADWLMPNDFEARVGRAFTMRCPPGAGIRGWIECVVLEIDPMRRMVWSWSASDNAKPSRVEFVLEAMPGGTRLTLTHSREPSAEERKRFSSGWREKLADLRRRLSR
jgi:uncharacterized protein YndB with AHSA1/START domain